MYKIALFLTGALCLMTSCYRPSAEARVHRILTNRMLTLATAEGCTGGTIAARFTALPGASAYFKYGMVTYSNDAKRKLLNIDCDSLARHSAVSEYTVREMAEQARIVGTADYSIATTGIAGPTGGTPDRPVGSVWIAVATPEHTISRLLHLSGNRGAIIRQAGTDAIKLLEDELRQE